MRKPQASAPINLPYASTVASFFGDQGAAQGNSFLGRLYKGGGRTIVKNNAAAPSAASNSTPLQASMEKASNQQLGGK